MIAIVAGNSAGVSRVANQPLEHEPSYWAATAEIEQPSPALEHDLDVDVAIVGAGYTGLSTAYHLKKDHGITATVVEANQIG